MPEKPKLHEHEYSTEELLKKAIQSQSGPDIYSNFVQVIMTQNEIIMDLYTLAPKPGIQDVPKMTHIQRVVFPHHLATGLISAMQTSWQAYQEKDMIVKAVQSTKGKE